MSKKAVTSVYAGQTVQFRTQMDNAGWRIAFVTRNGGDEETDGIEVMVIDKGMATQFRSGVLHETNPKWNDEEWIKNVYNSVQIPLGIGGQWRDVPTPETAALRELQSLRKENADIRRELKELRQEVRKEAVPA